MAASNAALRLLVVDDDDVDRERVRRMLLQSDPKVFVAEACGPADTIEILKAQSFDCVIIDYRLGALTGLELLEQIKAVAPQFYATIMVTGLGDEEIAGAAVRAGISDYLTKSQLTNVRLMHSVVGAVHRVSLERKLHELAYYDSLTGLASRTLLIDRLQQVINGCTRSPTLSALAYIDLDNFKLVNDEFGHTAGDQVLVEIGDRLRHLIRATDTAARLGGDEFVVLLNDIASIESCEDLISRISQRLKETIVIEGHLEHAEVQVTSSIGVVLIQDENVTADTVLRHADHMMYKVKRSGREGILFFDPQVEKSLIAISSGLEAVAAGLKRREFILYYQPKINLLTREVIGLEALIRWRHPEKGVLTPDKFWQPLQHQRLSVTLGEWVIMEAIRQLSEWRTQGAVLKVSVNISVHHLQSKHFVNRLGELLASAPDLPPHSLELEILETVVIDDIASTVEILSQCRALGVNVAVDDFGTGYSSLTYLKRLPLDTLKIDKSFVVNMLTSKDDKAIVIGIVSLCNAFNRCVLAEGVETDEHIRQLVEIGCLHGQGYGIAKPMPASEVLGWISHFH
ncbi:MAG TPA: EAL domain-containing protein [Pseudomonadales bacterium]|nr:EAL domain-containing protein [Pseudomonadales bacterium]